MRGGVESLFEIGGVFDLGESTTFFAASTGPFGESTTFFAESVDFVDRGETSGELVDLTGIFPLWLYIK